jgi:putative hydrolase of the HAD superfamily
MIHEASLKYWIFDLDNTLYPPSFGLIEQMERNILEYVSKQTQLTAQQFKTLDDTYFAKYGASFKGWVENYHLDPHHLYEHVNRIDLSGVKPIEGLKEALENLPGEKIIFTNNHHKFVDQILVKMQLEGCFDHIYDIEASGFIPKPHKDTYELLLKKHSINPQTSIMFEDSHKNLLPAAELGMKTVLLGPNLSESLLKQDYIHSHAKNLETWLNDYLEKHS